MYHKQCLNCDKVAKNQDAYFHVNKNNIVRIFFKSKAYKPSNEKMSYAICIQPVHSRGAVVVNNLAFGSRGRGFEPHTGPHVCP